MGCCNPSHTGITAGKAVNLHIYCVTSNLLGKNTVLPVQIFFTSFKILQFSIFLSRFSNCPFSVIPKCFMDLIAFMNGTPFPFPLLAVNLVWRGMTDFYMFTFLLQFFKN